jgi:hypothetical protein
MRPLIVMAASGAALVLGLLLIYVPGLRHPAILLVGAVGLGAAAAIYPEPALLLAQAASLGVVLTIVAGVFQGRAARRRVGPPREGSDAGLERSSTQTHRRPPSPADQAPTETAPAAVPVPSAGPSP